jgi:PIN domain nuclease of toxin-antitoxin system
MKKYVLDACALIALFQKETGAEIVESILIEAMKGFCSVSMNAVNLLEVYYGYLRADGEAFAERQLTAVTGSCIKVVDVLPEELLRRAGKLKIAHRMSLADAILIAQASINAAVVVTSDHHELDAIDKNGIAEFLWIR